MSSFCSDLSSFFKITDNNSINSLLFLIFLAGTWKLTTLTLSFLSLVLDLTIFPSVNYKNYQSKDKDCWAVVTGASDGIGKEFALQLAKKGFNILLASRTESKLAQLSTDIQNNFQVHTKILTYDASNIDQYINSISQSINGIPITILINNVGQSHSIPVPFEEIDETELNSIININCVSTLKFTKIVQDNIKRTIQSKKAKKGLILTMGSFSGLLPTPYLSVYSGSKAFLQNWSNSLSAELAGYNIDVSCLLSYLVTSKMSKIRRSSFMIPTPKKFVSASLNNWNKRCGAQERYMTSTPFWSHALMHWSIENTVGVYSKIANKLNYNMHKDIRRRALRKKARLASGEEKPKTN
ncbi:ketoreductase [Ascoidea rubescens DSM 1968]|uniref:Very-long-chain 3-oxoacyl-CoA reductase n=1 Tax=Ascoidea rubescens DSM 1968 TaxID=1344418 RepID=A0A1D2VI77_9ASCO|nr:3-ketoacyl-CoA reductase [Ascoidea rubescens DSM 1968]ODV61183.1 3-ketoacyl-CoA reductase [Ascoidea rubescens DSM 1968]